MISYFKSVLNSELPIAGFISLEIEGQVNLRGIVAGTNLGGFIALPDAWQISKS